MKTSYILKIENPCTESWAAMSKNDAGRYCKSCNKNVVDFSQLNDNEIIKYLSKNNSSKTCGRLEPHQLERIIKADLNKSKRNRFHQIITTLFLIGAAKSTVAQTQPSQHQTETSKHNNENIKIITTSQKNEQDSLAQIIEGIVISEEDKLPIPGVTITIKGTNSGVFTNHDGKFKLFIPENLKGKKIELDLRYIGFKQLLVEIKPSELQSGKEFKMCLNEAVLGGITIVKKKWWKFWKW